MEFDSRQCGFRLFAILLLYSKKKKKKASTFIVLDATVKTLHTLVLLVFTKT